MAGFSESNMPSPTGLAPTCALPIQQKSFPFPHTSRFPAAPIVLFAAQITLPRPHGQRRNAGRPLGKQVRVLGDSFSCVAPSFRCFCHAPWAGDSAAPAFTTWWEHLSVLSSGKRRGRYHIHGCPACFHCRTRDGRQFECRTLQLSGIGTTDFPKSCSSHSSNTLDVQVGHDGGAV